MTPPEETTSTPGMPEPPQRPAHAGGRPARMPRRSGLTEEAIVAAALEIVDADGLDALTMRAVASRLHTGAASLYAFVRSKEDLIELLMERVIAEMPFDAEPDPARWKEQIKAIARGMREVWSRHGDLARASFARVALGENALIGSELMVATLRAGEMSDGVVGLAADLLGLYVGASAYEDSLQAGFGMDAFEWQTYSVELERYFTALPQDRFPNIVALAGALTSQTDRFEFGLDVILAGLVAYDAEHAAGARP